MRARPSPAKRETVAAEGRRVRALGVERPFAEFTPDKTPSSVMLRMTPSPAKREKDAPVTPA